MITNIIHCILRTRFKVAKICNSKRIAISLGLWTVAIMHLHPSPNYNPNTNTNPNSNPKR